MLGSSAGYLSDLWGWRSAFFVLGLPGLLVAGVLYATVREPVRGRLGRTLGRRPWPALPDMLKFTRHQPALLHALLGGALYSDLGVRIVMVGAPLSWCARIT